MEERLWQQSQRGARDGPWASAWQVVRASLRAAADDFFTTLVVHLLWLVGNLLIIPGPPATLALFYTAHRMARGEVTGVTDFLHAFRRYWTPAWRWGLLNGAVIFFLAGDFWLTGRISQAPLARFIQGFYLATLAGWLLLQLYTLPFLIQQEQPILRQSLRNAALMVRKHPAFTLALAFLLLLVLLLSTIFFLVIFAAGGLLLALIGSHAVLDRLALE